MSHPPPITAPRSRTRRFIRWLVVTVFVGFAVTFAWNLLNRQLTKRVSDRELTAAVEQANADDPDWEWDRLSAARKRPPAGKNGAELIPRVQKLAHPDLGKWQAKDELKSRLEIPANVRYSPVVLAEVRRELAASADALALARTLKDCPSGYREIILTPNVLDTLLQDTADTRVVVDLLRWDAVSAVEDGDARAGRGRPVCETERGAVDRRRTVYGLANDPYGGTRGRGSLDGTTPGTGHRRARTPGTSVGARDRCRGAAAPVRPARGARTLDRLFDNSRRPGAATPRKALDWTDGTWAQFAWWHYRPTLRADRAIVLSWITTCIGFARLPIEEQQPLHALIACLHRKTPNGFCPGCSSRRPTGVKRASWRSTAEVRCAVVGIACERFRQQHKRWPGTLAELVPAFIPGGTARSVHRGTAAIHEIG